MTKKPRNDKVRPRHRIVLAKLSENGGILGKAIESAGYSKAIAKTPSRITESKSWKQLLEEQLPDEKLTRVHNKLLMSKNENVSVKALDIGYKVKQRYAEGTVNAQIVVVMPSQVMERVMQVENIATDPQNTA